MKFYLRLVFTLIHITTILMPKKKPTRKRGQEPKGKSLSQVRKYEMGVKKTRPKRIAEAERKSANLRALGMPAPSKRSNIRSVVHGEFLTQAEKGYSVAPQKSEDTRSVGHFLAQEAKKKAAKKATAKKAAAKKVTKKAAAKKAPAKKAAAKKAPRKSNRYGGGTPARNPTGPRGGTKK